MMIETARLQLIPFSPQHLLALIESGERFEECFGLRAADGLREAFVSDEVSPTWLMNLRSSTVASPWIHGFAVVDRQSRSVVGSLGFKGPPDETGAVEIAYGIVPEFRGRGYATEAAAAGVELAFASSQVQRVRAHTLPTSAASMRVLEKCGFDCAGEVEDPEDGPVWRWERGRVESPYDGDLRLSRQLADEAGAVALSYFRREPRRWRKSDGSLVTEADFAVEDALRTRLHIERPDDAVLGEERGKTGAGRRCWIIDAIDGTVAFAGGGSDWGALIALESDGRLVVGMCDQPVLERRYWAVKGNGAFMSLAGSMAGRRLAVSGARDLKLARSYIPPPEWFPDERSRRIAEALTRATSAEPAVDHPALQVADGRSDLAVFLTAGPWDLAGPALVVEEAGGRFTDAAGRHVLTSGNAVFSNGYLHDAVLQIIKSV